jgi:sugar phosphate isomerase/epimerase
LLEESGLLKENPMKQIDRRQFLQSAVAGAAAGIAVQGAIAGSFAQAPRKMTLCLSGGAIGASGNQKEMVDLAAKYGFESVEAHGSYLASLDENQMTDLKEYMKSKSIRFAYASMPVEFRKDDAAFAAGMKVLPNIAGGLKRAGVTRMSTYIMPCHDALTYLPNFKQHAQRLREAAALLKENGIRLGLEYVGPRTLMVSKRYPFIHTMAEARDLISEIGTGNVGLMLDTYHWWTAGDTEEDILALKNEDVVLVDLNDGVAGVPRESALDNKRELPCKTGVIDTAAFINAVNRIGYDGPIRAEPFNREVNGLGKEGACAATIESLKKVVSLLK